MLYWILRLFGYTVILAPCPKCDGLGSYHIHGFGLCPEKVRCDLCKGVGMVYRIVKKEGVK